MASSVNVTLATSGALNPTIVLNGGASSTNNNVVDVVISTSDKDTSGYKMLLWGDVDKTYNPNIQTQQSNIIDPTVAPVLAASGTGSALPAGTVYVVYTVADGYGETKISPEASVTITAGQNVAVTLPALPTGTNLKYNIYMSTATGTEKLQGSTTNTSYTQSSALATVTAHPSTNTLTGSTSVSYWTNDLVKLSTGDGVKTLYVVIVNALNKNSVVAQSSITYDTTAPIITTSNLSSASVNEVGAGNSITFDFQSDSAFSEYHVMTVPSPASTYAQGTQIGTSGESNNVEGLNVAGFAANTNILVTINGSDLNTASAGDGSKTVKVFVKDMSGNWSL